MASSTALARTTSQSNILSGKRSLSLRYRTSFFARRATLATLLLFNAAADLLVHPALAAAAAPARPHWPHFAPPLPPLRSTSSTWRFSGGEGAIGAF